MYWYIIHVKSNRENDLIRYFHNHGIDAFVPKMERWYNIKGKKDYILKDLYPNYVFIQTDLNKSSFDQLYHDFFNSIGGFARLLDFDEVYALNNQEQQLMEMMFDEGKIIRHSVGNIINSVLVVDKGPLVGLENRIIKINRHQRLATLNLNLFSQNMMVPLEVISKT